MRTGNLGEWAEAYTLLKLLVSDTVQTREGVEVSLNSIHKSSNGDSISFVNSGSGFLDNITTTSKSEIENALSDFKDLEKPKRGTFSAPLLEYQLKKLGINEIKAARSLKADVALSFRNLYGSVGEVNDYSIKSELKGLSSILNASGHTNFKYRIHAPSFKEISHLNSIRSKSKVKDKFQQLAANNFKVSHDSIISDDFRNNLNRVSKDAELIFSRILLAYFQGKGSRISELVTAICENEAERAVTEKIVKKVLVEFLLHSSPGDTQREKEHKLGGLLILDSSYELQIVLAGDKTGLADYIYSKAIIDTPSTTRHKFGNIYAEGGNSFVNLNLQVRLKP
jgi:hypothetical protein